MTKAFRVTDTDFKKTIKEFTSELGIPMDILYGNKHIFSTTPYPASYQDLEKDKVFRAATHIVRANAQAYKRYMDTVLRSANDVFKRQYSYQDVFGGMNMVIPIDAKKIDKLKVFSNLPLDKITNESIMNVSWIQEQETLSTVYQTYRKAMDNENAKQAWTPPSRALHRLCRTEEMPLSRVLARNTNLNKLGYSDSQLRDLAETIEEMYKPMEIKFTEKVEDYLHMYKTGPSSCMSLKEGKERTWAFLTEKGLHPSVMFHYSPYVKGVWSEKKGVIVARCFIYQREKDNKWVHGRIYASTGRVMEQFAATLLANDIEPLVPGMQLDPMRGQMFERKYTFQVPAVENGSDLVLPYPYFDNHSLNTYTTYDHSTRMFTIEVNGQNRNNWNFQTQNGFVSYRQFLKNAKCDCCGKNVDLTQNAGYPTQDGFFYCSSTCLTKSGYVYAVRSDGVKVVVKKDQAVQDMYQTSVFYTNEEAADRHGCWPYAESLDQQPEEETASRSSLGSPILIDNTVWRIPEAVYNKVYTKCALAKHPIAGQLYKLPDDYFAGEIAIDNKVNRAVIMDDDYDPLTEPAFVRKLAELRAAI